MRPLRQSGLLLALAALTTACAQCGGGSGPPPERSVPANVVAAVVVPELRGAARSLAEFYATAQDFPGTSDLPGLRASLSAQLGFDPLDMGAIREAGIEPRGGMALAWQAEPGRGWARRTAPLLVLPVANRAAAEGFVQRIAVERLGAADRAVEGPGSAPVTVYRARPGGPPALAVAATEGALVLCPGPRGPELVSRAVTLDAKDSLAENPGWQTARSAAGPDAAAIAFVPPGSPALEGLWAAVRDGVGLAIAAEPRRLRARLLVLLGDRAEGFAALTADGQGGALAGRLEPSAAIVGRWDGAPSALASKLLPLLPEAERARLGRAGIDLERELFGALAPGAAASISLAPRIQLSTLDAGSLRRDPLRLVQFELLLPVRDPARVAALSDRIVRLARQRQKGGTWSVPTASGEVAWAIDGGRLLAAGGAPGRLAALKARPGGAGGYRAPTDDARRTLAAGGLGALVVDTRNAAASVRALPPEAFGSGPTGFVMRSLVERFVEPAERIEAISLGVSLEPGALVLAVEVQPAPPEERAP